MVRGLWRASLASMLRFRLLKRKRSDDARRKGQEFATVLMLSAVVGVLCQTIEAVIDLGRSAGWWN